ncbi:MAG: virulence RhuM family protein [Candidatus Cloacimonetes bacterium]|nr:virulence RhuM family protein [Candidatus Cloacimonadota bacterium]
MKAIDQIHSEFNMYRSTDGEVSVEVRFQRDSVWLTLNQMAILFDVDKSGISRHLKNIYESGELQREATVAKNATVQTESGRKVSRELDYYSLDAIIAVGYRVNSVRGTQFRIWATQRLREYLIKGFVLDDERLKGHDRLTDHFDELLARIRDIRASEARAYQRIREIFSLAFDYIENMKETQIFFATMQNKMHYAATGLTAAELIMRRADADMPNMGLTSWRGDRVLKTDVRTAKNYLGVQEIDILNRIVAMFLDQAEFRVMRRQDIKTSDWERSLDRFLRDNDLPVLDSPGTVSRRQALEHANKHYDAYVMSRRQQSEDNAEKRYLDDLRQSAEKLSLQRTDD